jgi:hypothetical protein
MWRQLGMWRWFSDGAGKGESFVSYEREIAELKAEARKYRIIAALVIAILVAFAVFFVDSVSR